MGRSRTIVVVEDHEHLRDAIVEALTLAGWSVRSFETAEEALVFVRSSAVLPDVVLTDFNTGELRGPGLARELRVDPSTRAIVVVGMSGSVQPTPTLLSLFDHFMPKPIDVVGLDGVLRSVLGTQP